LHRRIVLIVRVGDMLYVNNARELWPWFLIHISMEISRIHVIWRIHFLA